jgi:hypothetical protein
MAGGTGNIPSQRLNMRALVGGSEQEQLSAKERSFTVLRFASFPAP